MNSHQLICADWVAPMDGPMLRQAGVVIAGGRIAAVGAEADLRGKFPRAVRQELGAAVLLPGLVNAHVHLELSDLTRDPRPESFVKWILNLMAQAARLGGATQKTVGAAIEIGARQCLRFGVTTVGDISKQCMFTRPALRNGPLRVVSFGEIQAMAKRRQLLDERFAVAADVTCQTQRLTVGISPHAPYTVEPQGYKRCLEFSRHRRRPLATHLAENPEEAEFLEHGTGPFRYLWETGINAWDNHVPRFSGGPIRFAREMELLDHPTLLAHVNYCDDDELAILAAGKASVVYCPRTHAYFGHPPHGWRKMLERGINVAVGTDSCASSPDLNLVDDLRLLRQLAPETEAMELWRMATIRAAKALQMESEVGSITVGKRADLAAFEARGDDPLEEILADRRLPGAVWIDGNATAWPD